jgi:hypothetical protein
LPTQAAADGACGWQQLVERIVLMTGEWIARLAEDERKRDRVRLGVTEAAARKAHLVAAHGQRLLDELRTTVARDIETFRGEFPADEAREIRFEAVQPGGGFAVHKPENPNAALRVTPHLSAASFSCEYRFTPTNGLPPREDRLEFMFTSDRTDETLQIKHHGTGQVFTDADALSEYLLVPVFTGRPR